MLENISLSLRGIWSHKMRSFLTMLGVIIGIASIIAIVSIVEGTNQKLEKSLVGSGNNVTSVQLCQDSWPYDFTSLPTGVPVVNDSELEEMSQIDGVESVTAYRQRNDWNAVFYLDKGLSNSYINGITGNYFETMQYSISQGRNFNEDDYTVGRKVAIVDSGAVDSLFDGADPIGKVIEVKGEPFVIVGVVEDDNAEKVEYDSIDEYYMYGYSQMGNVYIPSEAWPLIYQFDEPQSVGIRVTNTKEMASIGSKCSDILNMYVTSDTLSYQASNALESAEELKTITNAIKIMLVSIASLSLLVGGIGVMNIMLVSVTERTSEIGLKKALGAKKRTILAQFLTESAVLTSVGGITGVLLGIGLAKIISVIASLDFAISIPSIVVSVLFSMGIGILFGMLPSYKAAKLNPIDALRRE